MTAITPYRDHFPILDKKVYLNSCSQGALSQEVAAAYTTYLHDWQEKGSPWGLWVELLESARAAYASLLNAKPDEIAVTASVSAGVNALASALDFSGPRHKIVSTAFEFPTVAQIWHAQERRGARVVHVPAVDNQIPLESFEAAIDEQTLLVSVTHVAFRTGYKLDIPAIVEIARRKGAFVLLDSYQAVGTMAIDFQALDVDFLVGGTLKYLLASAGIAFMAVRESLIPTLTPTASGWFAQSDIFAMDITQNAPSASARRFESGTPPVPNIYAALAGLRLVEEVGLTTIEASIRDLTDALKAGIRERGFKRITPDQHGAMITIRSHDVERLVASLADEGIILSSRDDNLRISPHFYNNLADIDCLLDGLTKYRHLLA